MLTRNLLLPIPAVELRSKGEIIPLPRLATQVIENSTRYQLLPEKVYVVNGRKIAEEPDRDIVHPSEATNIPQMRSTEDQYRMKLMYSMTPVGYYFTLHFHAKISNVEEPFFGQLHQQRRLLQNTVQLLCCNTSVKQRHPFHHWSHVFIHISVVER